MVTTGVMVRLFMYSLNSISAFFNQFQLANNLVDQESFHILPEILIKLQIGECYNIKFHLKEMCEDTEWIRLAQDAVQ
jgi:hypothetical protein